MGNDGRERIECTCTICPVSGDKKLCKHCFARDMTNDHFHSSRKLRGRR